MQIFVMGRILRVFSGLLCFEKAQFQPCYLA